jgi:hypothetical protein
MVKHAENMAMSYVPESLQVLVNTQPEHSQTIKAEADTGIVHDADIEISRGRTEIALLVFAACFENQRSDRKHWLHLNVF